jgi:probable addiction module antidote protein
MSKTTQYKEYLGKSLSEPGEAAAYLNAALEAGDLSLFALALKDVVDALGGGVSATSKKSHLDRGSLYRMLSKKGNPRLTTLYSVINSLGLEIRITARKGTALDRREDRVLSDIAETRDTSDAKTVKHDDTWK